MIVILCSGLIGLLVVSAGYGYTTMNASTARAQIEYHELKSKKLTTELEIYQEKLSQYQKLQRQLSGLQRLTKEHQYWSRILDFLEDNTVVDVSLVSLKSQRPNEIVLVAVAPNYNGISRQIMAFSQLDSVVKANVVSARLEEKKVKKEKEVTVKKEVRFELRLMFEKDFLSK